MIEESPSDVEWHAPPETQRILAMMSEVNRAKVDAAKSARHRLIGTLYKRTRFDARGERSSAPRCVLTMWRVASEHPRAAQAANRSSWLRVRGSHATAIRPGIGA